MALQQIGLSAILDDKNFQAGLSRYSQGINKMTSQTDKAAGVLTRLGSVASGALVVGLGAATAAFGAMVGIAGKGITDLQQWGDQLDKLGDQFGLTGEQASGFTFLANKVGLSVDEMGMGLNTLTRGLAEMKNAQTGNNLTTAKSADAIKSLKERIVDAETKLARANKTLSETKKPTDGMRNAVDDARKSLLRLNGELAGATKLVPKATDKESDFAQALKSLGVSAFTAKGKLKTFDQVLPEIMDKFKKLPPGIKASELAMKLFGSRGGSKFLDFLRQGSKGLTEAQQKAKLLGLELSSNETDAIEEFGFMMNEVGLALKGFWVTIGREVLPVLSELVGLIVDNSPDIINFAKFIGVNLANALKGFSTIAQDLFILFSTGDAHNLMETLDKAFGRETANNIGNIIQAVMNLVKAFQTGGLSGLIDQVGKELGKAFSGFDLAKTLGDIGGKIATELSKAWTKISPELTKWGKQFWEWLIGKNGSGGVLGEAATQLGKVWTAITGWIEKNGPATWKLIEKWVPPFWQWLTDTAGGLLSTVADNMQKLFEAIEAWATAPETIIQFQGIGEKIANDILTGIGNFFENPEPSGENILMKLWNTLERARIALTNTIASLGGSIAGGIVGGIAGFFFGAEAKQKVTQAMTHFFTELQKIMLSPGGPVTGLITAIVRHFTDKITQAFNDVIKSFKFDVTPTKSPNNDVSNFDVGGPVRKTGPARLLAGEYVLNRQQAQAMSPMLSQPNITHNNFNWQNSWTGSASGFDLSQVAEVAREAAFSGIKLAMENA